MSDYASALPRKRFFIDMFTRDIALEDCVLDLVDNSIDALFRLERIKHSVDLDALVKPQKPKSELPEISLKFNDSSFIVEDNCGGIPFSVAKDHVFNFGHDENNEHVAKLGVYGIGLKRAIFKIGNTFTISSKTTKDGFKVSDSISEWIKKDESLDDWRFEIKAQEKGKDNQAGTKIEIKDLYKEVLTRMNDGSFEAILRNLIATTYMLFLEKDLRIKVNGKVIEPYPTPIGKSELVTASNFKKKYSKVEVQLVASLAERDSATQEWKAEKAGWYIFCNGRMVVGADKTALTGWGAALLPIWHSKYRGFIGLAFFSSQEPFSLPWTTTKRGINRESEVFQQVRVEMQKITRPVISFLNDMYKGEEESELEERKVAESVKTADLVDLTKRQTQFSVKVSKRQERTTTKISYEVDNADLKRIKKAIGHSEWKPSQVGEYTFNYCLKRECSE